MIEHRVIRTMDETGYRASCRCGWRTARRTREVREQDVAGHEVQYVTSTDRANS